MSWIESEPFGVIGPYPADVFLWREGLEATGEVVSRDKVVEVTAMQGQSRQVGDRCLQGVEAIVERQECVAPEGDDDGFVCGGEHRGAGVCRAGSEVMDRASLPPLGDRLRIEAVSPGQGPQARLTILYCSTDRLCRRGAAV